ncbi:MAG: exodeoxyribonuclease V subunit alpha, partial [Desulfosarcina sp.]
VQAVIDGLYREEAVIRGGIGKDPIVRDPCQEAAIRAALTASLLVISGGPGTGKTSLLANVLRALVGIGTDPSRIVLAAPTGRAAQRMIESMSASLATIAAPDHRDRCLGRLNGSTLHKLLVYRTRTHGFWYGEHRHLPADVVVVDEVSMVDVVMMDRLFQAIDPHRTRVILLGDKDQLPSVDAGSVLADMRPTDDGAFAGHFIMLQHVYRSGGELLDLAKTINVGDPVSLTPVSFDRALARGEGTWSFIAAKDGRAIDRIIDQWVRLQYLQRQDETDDSYVDLVRRLDRLADSPDGGTAEQRMALLGRLFGFAYRCRLLTVLRRGRTGAQWINNCIGSGLRQILDPACNPDDGWFNGALIMVTRNDYTRELFNGDVGVVLRQTDGTYRVYFRRADGVVDLPVSGLSDWDLTFAMTVHKSQGSEFDDTLLMLPETTDHRLLTREIIYTAATRASRRLIVCGNPDAFQTALKRKIHRHSGLGLSSG